MSDDEDVPFLIKKCIRYALDDYQLFVYNIRKKVRPNFANFTHSKFKESNKVSKGLTFHSVVFHILYQSLRFYVKSSLRILAVQNLAYQHFERL